MVFILYGFYFSSNLLSYNIIGKLRKSLECITQQEMAETIKLSEYTNYLIFINGFINFAVVHQ